MTLEKRVQALVAALTNNKPLVEPFDALVAESKRSSPLERDAAIRTLLAWESDHAELTGYTCVASGALVEDGASTLVGLDTILDRLADGTELLATLSLDEVDLDAYVPPPSGLAQNERRWIAGWKSHVRGVMARLARDVEARKRLRAHERLVRAVRRLADNTYAHHLRYITEIVDMLDDEPLHVIDLCNGGALLRYRAFGVRNGFHLMTLLDGGDPLAIANRGQDFFAATHSWYSWNALRMKDGRFVAEGLMALLWGEPPARYLSTFEGVRTIIRAPLGMQRSWGTSLISPIHHALHEHLVLEQTLPPIEAQSILSRIARLTAER